MLETGKVKFMKTNLAYFTALTLACATSSFAVTFEVLRHFTGSTDGAYPYAGLILGVDGNYYGVSRPGTSPNQGALYSMTSTGAFSVVAQLSQNYPADGPVTQGSDTNFYGSS